MTPRIKELAEQAKQFAREQMAHPIMPELFSANVFQQKFAELIINETLSVACDTRTNAVAEFEIGNRKDLYKFLVGSSSAAMVEAVKKHFEVK